METLNLFERHERMDECYKHFPLEVEGGSHTGTQIWECDVHQGNWTWRQRLDHENIRKA